MPEADSGEARAEIALIATASGETILELVGPPVMPAAMFAGGNQLHLALGSRSGRAWMIVIDLDARTFRIPGRVNHTHPLAGLGAALDALREPDIDPAIEAIQTPLPHYLCARHRPLPLGWRTDGSLYSDTRRFRVDFAAYTAVAGPVRAARIVVVDSDDVLLWNTEAEFVESSTDLIKLKLVRVDEPASTRTAFSDLGVEMFWPDLGPGPHPEAVRYLDELHAELAQAHGILTYDGPPPSVRPSRMRPEMILRQMDS
jgi:hypothetical protein